MLKYQTIYIAIEYFILELPRMFILVMDGSKGSYSNVFPVSGHLDIIWSWPHSAISITYNYTVLIYIN